MPMNSGLTSSSSEFTKRSEFSKSPLRGESSSERGLYSSVRNMITGGRLSLAKVGSLVFVRSLIMLLFGVAATLAWQSYGDASRKTIAGWSSHLAWLAPATAPTGTSAEQSTALALAAVKQSVDKLTAEINKLQTQGADRASRSGSRRL
jgi:hypothetical protein